MIESYLHERDAPLIPVENKFPKRVGEGLVLSVLAAPQEAFSDTDFTPNLKMTQDNFNTVKNWRAVIRGYQTFNEGRGALYTVAFTPESIFQRAVRRLRDGKVAERQFIVDTKIGVSGDSRFAKLPSNIFQ